METDDLEVGHLDRHESLELFWSWRLEICIWIDGWIGKSIYIEAWSRLFLFDFFELGRDPLEFDAYRISLRRRDWRFLA